MVISGIPYYLCKIDGSLTLAENVDRLFFVKDAQLNGEFNDRELRVFLLITFFESSIFGDPSDYSIFLGSPKSIYKWSFFNIFIMFKTKYNIPIVLC